MKVYRKLLLVTHKIFRQAKYLLQVSTSFFSFNLPISFSKNTGYSANKVQKAKHSLFLLIIFLSSNLVTLLNTIIIINNNYYYYY